VTVCPQTFRKPLAHLLDKTNDAVGAEESFKIGCMKVAKARLVLSC
jgi:hypothetical protein